MREFLHVPHEVHAQISSRWIAPLKLYERIAMGRVRAPGKGFWLVRDGQRAVARMGAIIHRHGDESRVHFGFFECCEGYPEATLMLMEKVRELGPGLEIQGPYNFTLEDPYVGVLVEGFEHEPAFLSAYNPPYYDDYLKGAGLERLMDLYSYLYYPHEVRLDRMERRARKAAEAGIEVRMMDVRRKAQEMRTCIAIAEKAWVDNWGYEEFSEEITQTLILFCRLVFEPNGTLFAHHRGKDVGFAWVLRNFNELLKPAAGSITLRLIWDFFTRRKQIRTYRGYALGVLPEYQKLPVAPALVHAIMSQGEDVPWDMVEVSWVLATNTKMNAMAKALGGRHEKTHRVYGWSPQ